MDLLPLDTVPAVKVYLGLPLFGARAVARRSASVADRQMKSYGCAAIRARGHGRGEQYAPL